MSILEQVNALLTEAKAKSMQVERAEWLTHKHVDFLVLRQDSTLWADARHAQKQESMRLREKGAEIACAAEAAKLLEHSLRLDVPEVKSLWDQAIAFVTNEKAVWQTDGAKNDANRTHIEAYRLTIVTRGKALREFTHSEEECARRNEIKWDLRWKIEHKKEGVEIERFCTDQQRLMREIGEKLDAILPSLIAESDAKIKKETFVTKMRTAKAAKKNKVVAEAIAIEVRLLTEEAELQRMIAEEKATKQAAEDKAKVVHLLSQIELAESVAEVRDLALAAFELDKSVNVLAFVRDADIRFNAAKIRENLAEKKDVVCHVDKHLRAKDRRQMERSGVRGKNWADVVVEA